MDAAFTPKSDRMLMHMQTKQAHKYCRLQSRSVWGRPAPSSLRHINHSAKLIAFSSARCNSVLSLHQTGMEDHGLSGNSIRVLHINRLAGSSEPVCHFQIASLDDPPKYTAISYCWGDSTPVAWLLADQGQRLPLSRTLYDLFNSLLEYDHTFTLWIDALCIDQHNLAERESQVLQMGKVFASATNVLVWLGESDPLSKKAFHAMKHDEPDQDGLESIFMLLQRPWFQRVWVIQEVALGRRVWVGCGEDGVSFPQFTHYIFTVWRSFARLGNYNESDPAMRGLWCVTRLIHIQNEYRGSSMGIAHKQRAVSYESLIQAAFHCNATDKRDMIFAFRGIADSRPVPKPNYSISEEELYTETAKALLCHSQSLDLLVLCGIGNNSGDGLPTWAPDLRHHSLTEPLVPCNSARWNAGGPLQISPQVVMEPSIALQVQIQLVDEVDAITPAFKSSSVLGQKETVNAVLDLRLRSPADASDETWMDRVMLTLIDGVDIDDAPLETGTPELQHYRDEFLKWLEWLRSSSCDEDLPDIAHNKYHRTLRTSHDGDVAFMTRHGYLCVGNAAVAAGDMLCVVPGCRIPLVLRPLQGLKSSHCSTATIACVLVGWCYADGLMFGEAANLNQALQSILLY